MSTTNKSSNSSSESNPPLSNPLKAISESNFVKEFREFINRGSIVDLAIGVAVGGAFTSIVKSLVDDIVMPITSLLAGGLDFSTLSIDIPNVFGADSVARIAYGNFIQNVVNFLIIAFVIFLIVRTMNRLNRKQDQTAADAKAAAESGAEATSASSQSSEKSPDKPADSDLKK